MTLNEITEKLSERVKRALSRMPFITRLNESELSAIENEFGFIFPPDLRFFLQTPVPKGGSFVNWHSMSSIRKAMEWPWEGIAFDIENNVFWYDSWGEKPDNLHEQLEVAKSFYDKYPKLIPIYAHRYMPATPTEAGNPIFSVYQTDIVYYGYDLASYLDVEFGFKRYESLFPKENPYEHFKHIEFWSDMAMGIHDGLSLINP